jgi:hypothetical protein
LKIGRDGTIRLSSNLRNNSLEQRGGLETFLKEFS